MDADSELRRLARQATWTARVYRGPDVHGQIEADDLAEWAAMDPTARLALTWSLSLEQEGIPHDADTPARLPRSAYRVEPRPQDVADVDVLERQAKA